MRICRVSHAFFPREDGMSRHATLLSEYQHRGGHEVLVLQPYAIEMGTFPYEVVTPMRPASAPPGGRYVRSRFAAACARWIRESEREFDVIHVHGDLIDAHYAARESRRRKVPIVLTLHAGLNTRLRYRLVAPAVLRGVDRLIAVSRRTSDQLRALGLPPERISVISSGVETDKLATRRTVGGTTRVAFVASGSLIPMKGFRFLIEAFLDAPLPEGCTLTIIGEGPERRDLEQASAADPRIKLLGHVPHDRAVALLRDSDVFLMPSVDLKRKAEGTPTALLEAMAAGLACVVTDAGGMDQVITAGVNGVLVRQRDVPALAEALRVLRGDPELRRALGDRAAEDVRSRDWTIIAERVVGVYEDALRTHAGT